MKSVYPNLDDQIKKQRLSYTEFARIAGISRSGLYRRLWGTASWKLPEMVRICSYFEYYDAILLFAKKNVAEGKQKVNEKSKEVV